MKRKKIPSTKGKKPRRGQKPPKLVIGEAPERPEPGKEYDLIEHGRLPYHRVVEFPQMKGRTVKMIRFYSSADENTIAIRFHDRTHLSFRIEPALVLSAGLIKIGRWDCDTIKPER